MTAIQQMELNSRIDEDAFGSLSELLFHSVSIKKDYKSASAVAKKEELIDDLISFLNKYLALKVTVSSKQKSLVMELIYKLTMQKELIELQAGKLKTQDIELASIRLGKKAQSAFKGK